ncbi:MAG: hypothetical protein M3619_00725 [Myxococcota bacterium]|nr:hypothetical protein [Myxococcota bacterium]
MRPTPLGWARHLASRDRFFHAIAAVSFGGSTVTHCRGRWPEGDTTERASSPPTDLQCGGCVGRLLEIESVERGLAEFVQEAGR